MPKWNIRRINSLQDRFNIPSKNREYGIYYCHIILVAVLLASMGIVIAWNLEKL